jgi:SAM-dependent methyltransferase
MNDRRAVVNLFLASALSLYTELVLIRWVASELRIFAFYKNFALIGAFLGLGLGFAAYRRIKTTQVFVRYYFPLVFLTVLLVILLGRTGVSDFVLANQANTQEYVWAGYVDSPTIARLLDAAFYAILLSVFVLITALFLPIGQLVAHQFQDFEPLKGYTINIVGSLAGILLYTLISFLRWPPAVWFLIAGAGAFYLLPRTACLRNQLVNGSFAVLPILLTLIPAPGVDRTLWSPYYRIDLTSVYSEGEAELLLGYKLSVNQAWHQMLWNLDQDFVEANYVQARQHFDARYAEYDAPYSVAKSLDEVLIVGAGAGNDVAAAQRAGANHIAAVEIDPLILDIGRDLHPEDPYSYSPEVNLIVQDARSFFRRSGRQYDLIVFGLLDSHTVFSSASSVRLDSFVYTMESLSEARALLAKDGLLALSFGVPAENEWIGLRLYRMLTEVFGHSPQVYETPGENIVFLIGHEPFSDLLLNDPRLTHREDYAIRSDIDVTTDQWPFLYLRGHTIPTTYIIGLIGVVILSIVFVRRILPDFHGFNAHFFFMGAAFFLLETKSITEIALLLGSTWVVNAVVIAAILAMIVIANMIVERSKISNVRPMYAFLFVALLFNFFFPFGSFLGLPLVWRVLLAALAQALPLFFAGLIFAVTFSRTRAIEIALGSNLVGSVLGGIFEYSSLALGIRSLYLLALGFYVLSAVAWRRSGFSK